MPRNGKFLAQPAALRFLVILDRIKKMIATLALTLGLKHGLVGVMQEGVLDLICLNSRMPGDTRGDVLACLASLRAGAARLDALLARYGAATTAAS